MRRALGASLLVLSIFSHTPVSSAQPASPAPPMQPATTAATAYQIDNVALNTPHGSTDTKGNLYDWSSIGVQISWSAPHGVKQGDVFNIHFPKDPQGKPLLFLKKNKHFPLKNGNQDGGFCEIKAAEDVVSCTLNDNFVGKDKVHGTITVGASTRQARSDISDLVFGIADKDFVEKLPGSSQGIVAKNSPFPQENFKSGWFENSSQQLTWALYIAPGQLHGDAPLRIADSIPDNGGPHSFKCDSTVPQAQAMGYLNDPSVLADLDAKATTRLHIAEQNFSPDFKRTDLRIDAPAGGWDAQQAYRIKYHSCVTGEGTEFRNDATFNGSVLGRAEVTNNEDASGTIQGIDRGSYIITQHVAADSAPVDPEQVFKVKIVVDSPNDAFDSTEIVDIKADGFYVGKQSLPLGTKVTVTEPELPSVPGLTFNEPQFKADEKHNPQYLDKPKGVVVNVLEDGNASVLITNSATVIPGTQQQKEEKAQPWWATFFALPFRGGNDKDTKPSGGDNQIQDAPVISPATSAPATGTQLPPGESGTTANTQPPTTSGTTVAKKPDLANTGVRILEIVVLALVVLIIGIVIIKRSRNKN